MHRYRLTLLAGALAALAAPALAGSPFYASPDTRPAVHPSQVSAARPVRRMGPFSCSFNEQRTKLERKNCGGQRF